MAKISRNTKQKMLIKHEIMMVDAFFSAEDLYMLVKKKDNSIGIATVYRFLNEMKKNGELYSYICDRKTVYSKEKRSHCHFVCEKTGKIIHFDVDSLDFLKNKIPGSIASFQLEVRGICNSCSKDEK
jgi:Fur family ferric uptake transcriptional regulator